MSFFPFFFFFEKVPTLHVRQRGHFSLSFSLPADPLRPACKLFLSSSEPVSERNRTEKIKESENETLTLIDCPCFSGTTKPIKKKSRQQQLLLRRRSSNLHLNNNNDSPPLPPPPRPPTSSRSRRPSATSTTGASSALELTWRPTTRCVWVW